MYKLILLDYSMPEMDGPQVAFALGKLFKASVMMTEDEIPYICCLSAYTEAGFKSKAISSGMNDFMTKPITSEEQLQKLINIIDPT